MIFIFEKMIKKMQLMLILKQQNHGQIHLRAGMGIPREIFIYGHANYIAKQVIRTA